MTSHWDGSWRENSKNHLQLWILAVNMHSDLQHFQRAFCLTLQLFQHSHFHLENLLGLLSWFHLQGHILTGQQIHCLIDLPKATSTNLLQLEKHKELWYNMHKREQQTASHQASSLTAQGEQAQLPVCAVPESLHCTAWQRSSYPLDCAMYKFFALTTKNKPSKQQQGILLKANDNAYCLHDALAKIQGKTLQGDGRTTVQTMVDPNCHSSQ